MPTRPRIIGDFIIEEEVGRGSFATVYKGFHKHTGLNVAVKVIQREKLNHKLLHNLEAEINLLKECNHENIVKLLVAKKTENHIYLIMEYCSGGDFAKWLRKRKVINEIDARFYLGQLAMGLSFMHGKGLIHRDLKPQNFLLTEKDKDYCCLKIADFGFAKHLNSTADLAATVCGSPLYMAPEILTYEKYDGKADLWSLGIILYEMIWGKPPFCANNHIELAQKYIQKQRLKFPTHIQIIETMTNGTSSSKSTIIQIKVSNECKDLLNKLLQVNPKERISFKNFFTHPFFSLPIERPIPVYQRLKDIPNGNSMSFLGEQYDSLTDQCSAQTIRLVNDCKWAHFLLLIYEETNNFSVLQEVARLLKCSIQYCTENRESLSAELQMSSTGWEESLQSPLRAGKQFDDQMPIANIYDLMIKKAIQIARNGAVEESLGFNQLALHLYEVSLFLFSTTKNEIKKGSFQDISESLEFSTEKMELTENALVKQFDSNLKLRITHLKNRK